MKSKAKKKHISLVLPAKQSPFGPVVTIPEPPAPVETISEQLTGTAAPAPAKPKTAHPAVAEIAEQLGETKPWPLKQIKATVWALGGSQARELAARALEIHAGEGMLVKSGQRKRTAGGIFFALCYSEGKPKEGRTLVKPAWKRKKPVQTEAPAGQSLEKTSQAQQF